MPEPTKDQIQIVFKKLKQNRYNKVDILINLLPAFRLFCINKYMYNRLVSIVIPRTPIGLQSPLVYIYVLIVLLLTVI